MIGVAVAALFTVVGASMKATAASGADHTLTADLVVDRGGYGGAAGRVAPSMAAANTNASSQNATRREAARRPRQVAGERLRQSIQAKPAVRPELAGALWLATAPDGDQ